MNYLISVIMIPVLFLVVPYFLGMLWNQLVNNKDNYINSGMAIYFPFGLAIMLFVFQIFAVPMIFFHASFNILVILWACGTGILCLVSAWLNKERMLSEIKKMTFNSVICKKNAIWIAVFLMIIFQTCLLTFNMHMDTDDSRFIAEAMEAYEMDTMLMIHPINGSFLGNPVGEMIKELTSPFPFFIAAMSKLTTVHPAIMAHVIFPLFLIPLCYLVIYSIGKYFFKDDRELSIFMLIFSVITLFSFESIYAFGYTLLTIIWQGRSIVATIMLPFMWLLLMKIYTEELEKKSLLALAIVSLACGCLSGMGLMMSVVLTGVYAVSVLIVNRDFVKSVLMLSTSIPCIIYFLCYCIISGGK